MQNVNSISPAVNVIDRLQIKETVLVLAAAVLIPFLLHFIPSVNGTPIGAILLSMFFAPLIAVNIYRYHTALIAAVFAPVVNFLITGMPQFQLVQIMSIELAVFVTIVYLLNKVKTLRFISAPLSYILTMAVVFVLLSLAGSLLPGKEPLPFVINSISNGAAGIVLLTIINIVTIKMFRKEN